MLIMMTNHVDIEKKWKSRIVGSESNNDNKATFGKLDNNDVAIYSLDNNGSDYRTGLLDIEFQVLINEDLIDNQVNITMKNINEYLPKIENWIEDERKIQSNVAIHKRLFQDSICKSLILEIPRNIDEEFLMALMALTRNLLAC